jgi:hypothetical protein
MKNLTYLLLMKTIFIAIVFKLLIIDSQTNENLVGAKVETNNNTYFTDLYGYVEIPQGEEIKSVSYISYETKHNIEVTKDTIIDISPL